MQYLLNSNSDLYVTDTCQNPQGQQGICINIRKCSSLLNLLQSNPQDPQVGNYLRSSVCGYEGTDPLVCCPRDGGTGEDVDRGSRQEIVTTQYGPLYPPECGYSNVTLRRIVGGEPALLGKHVTCQFLYCFLS